MKSDALHACEALVAEARCIASAHVVDVDGAVLLSVPPTIDDWHRAEVSRLGRQVARVDHPRPCMRADIDNAVACIAMTIANGRALVVVFFDGPDNPAGLPRLMARAVARLRLYVPDAPPDDGGNTGTPNEARAWVSVRDFDVN